MVRAQVPGIEISPVLDRPVLHDGQNICSNFQRAILVVGVDDDQGDSRITLDVAYLEASPLAVHLKEPVGVAEPNDTRLGPTVSEQRAEHGGQSALHQISVGRWNHPSNDSGAAHHPSMEPHRTANAQTPTIW